MKQVWIPFVALSLVACGSSRSECDGEPTRGVEQLPTQLTRLEPADNAASQTWIIQTQEDWEAVVVPVQGAPDMPDFEQQVAFVNIWAFDGCAEFPTYTAYLYPDRLRLAFDNPIGEETCDLALPYMDVVVVERAQEDLGWCDL